MARKHHEMKTSHVYALSALCIMLSIWSMGTLLTIGS